MPFAVEYVIVTPPTGAAMLRVTGKFITVVPTLPSTMLALPTFNVGSTTAAGLMTMLNGSDAFGSVPLLATMLPANVPGVVGKPLMRPEVALSVNPGGKLPLPTLKVMGALPVATIRKLYAMPTVPPGGEAALVMTGAVSTGGDKADS